MMEINFNNSKIGKDEEGYYFLVPLSNDRTEKYYVEEILEEYLESDNKVNISISTETHETNFPNEQKYGEAEINRVRSELDLQPKYTHLDPKLNVHEYLHSLYQKYPPALQFKAKTKEEMEKWRTEARAKLIELIDYDYKKEPIEVEWGPKSFIDGINLQKITFKTGEFIYTTGILAYQENINKDNPAPGVVCVHGHNKGKICTIGMYESSSDSYYGFELAKRGFVTLSLDEWGWGEREGRRRNLGNPEHHYSLAALLLGKTAIGIRAVDVSKSIDVLESLDFVTNKFGVIGQSGGGTTSAFSSAIDDRIYAAVISGYFCDFYESIFSIGHCSCNYIYGILKHMDLPDIVSLRAPKPTFIVSGEFDPIFPQVGVQSAYKKVQNAFDVAGNKDNLEIDVIKGKGHVFRGDFSYPFLEKHLK